LKVDIKNIGPCEKVLTIDVPLNLIQEEFDQFYEYVSKRSKIPGFRPGHAPKNIVALHYKKEAHDEVLKQLLSRSFREAVKEKGINLIGTPKIDEIDFNDQKLKYNAHVEIRPEIKIENYAGLKLKKYVEQVDQKDIQDVLKRYQEAHSKFEAVENREIQVGDYIIGDYVLEVDGKEVERRNGEWFEIREKDYLENFSKQLLGANVGESCKVKIKFPADYAHKEFVGKDGCFTVTIKEHKLRKLPNLDDDLAKEIGEYQTLAELTAAVKKDLSQQKQEQAETELERELLTQLIKISKFDIPQGMVDRRQKALVENQIQQIRMQGAKEEDVEKQREQMAKDLRDEADRQVRLSFLLDEIGKREKIEVTASDIETRLKLISERARRSFDEVKTFYHEKQERLDSIEQQIFNEKVIEWLKGTANITECKK